MAGAPGLAFETWETTTRTNPSPEEAEALLLFLFRDGGLAAHGSRHLSDCARDRRVFLHQRDGGVLHPPHRHIVVGNLPLRLPGESFGHLRLVDLQGARVVAVDDDFQFRTAFTGELCNQSVRVAQFGDADLRDQVDGSGFIEEMRMLQV